MTDMTSDALVEFLRTWRPPPTSSWHEHDRDSLSAALCESVEVDAEQRSSDALSFIGLPSDYVTSIIEGLGQAAAKHRSLDWQRLLPLCTWIDERAQAELDAGTAVRSERQWLNARVATLRLVIHACNSDQCFGEGRADLLWALILAGCADPDPDASVDDRDDGETNAVLLEGTRAFGIRAAIAFGLCAKRANAQADLTQVRPLLDRHLDIEAEPSLAVRATYGSLFEELLELDSDWTTRHVDVIFSTNTGRERYLQAAWHALLLRNRNRPLTDGAWTVLSSQLERAIDDLDPTTTDEWKVAWATHLGNQLLRRYWNGKLTLTQSDQLLQRFYQHAPAETAEALMRNVGGGLRNESPLDAALSDRLMALWKFRVDAVDVGAADPGELSQFDQWFVSGVFDDTWSLQQMLVALKRCHDMRLDARTLSRLAELSSTHAFLCLAILDQWVANDPDYWALSGHEDLLQTIIATGRVSGEVEETLARKIVSVILGQYGIDLRNALRPPSPGGTPDEVA